MQLLALLADGHWHTGPQLAERLQISRAAINKQVQKARMLGVQIQGVHGRGYRLTQAYEPLIQAVIRSELSSGTGDQLAPIEVLGSVDSTNNYLLQQSDPGSGGQSATMLGRACFAEHQSGGRGRRGRQWISPYGSNLYFSVAWTFRQTPSGLGALSLAIGIELATILRTHGMAVCLKWPNDLYVDGRKLGGILIEHRGEVGGGSRVVVGVGLNITMARDQAADIDQPWTSVAEHVPNLPARNLLAAQALDAVVRALRGFESQGFAVYRQRWQALDIAYEQVVEIDTGNEKFTGRATGVAADGALILDCAGSLRRIYAGELSLRLKV